MDSGISIFPSLTHTFSILSWQEMGEMTADSVSSRLPDTCLAFRLHLECGAMINVYDWMQAFISVHESSNSSADTKELWLVRSDSCTYMIHVHNVHIRRCIRINIRVIYLYPYNENV